jgi:hypothetical protein
MIAISDFKFKYCIEEKATIILEFTLLKFFYKKVEENYGIHKICEL